ncbi:SulP family inorganic anion transporter [Aquabacterium sp.]|uniref:SulP family inorganic anion transporter n=1 Tax=Aquabacterium sp. TaxID=1872578 RepID=UPI002E32D577|nr:SulP family inorganic anion transporter [Aquabacterium sp.]HEX5310892.1 SulP family inorganic anion transporter [Aquabacterium sp.]
MPRWPDLALGRPTGKDVLAGLSLAGLLLPEAVAYAGLGNMPPQAGIVALFVGLLAYGLLGCSRFAIVSATSSSAALLAAAVGSMSIGHLDWRVSLSAGLVGVAGGLFLLGAVARLGAASAFVAKPVVKGYTFGLALLIIIRQMPGLLSVHTVGSDPMSVLSQIAAASGQWHGPSFLVGVLALTALFALSRHLRWVPAGLVVMAAGIAAQEWAPLSLYGVPAVGTIAFDHVSLRVPVLDWGQWLRVGELAFAMVLILYAESYSSIRSLALRHGDPVRPDRDLLALGVANVLSGLLQGMPVGAGYSASAANEAAGARTRWAGLMAAAAVGILVALFLPWVASTPVPVLAAVVIWAVSHTLRWETLAPYFVWQRDRLLVCAAVLAVLVLGVLDGLLLSIGISLFLTLKSLTEARIAVLGRLKDSHDFIDLELYPHAKVDPDILVVRPEAPMFFWNAERLMVLLQRTLAQHGPAAKAVVLSLEESPDLDGSCIEALRELSQQLLRSGQHLIVARLKSKAYTVLQRAHLPGVTLTVLSIDEAVTLARKRTA